MSYWLSWWAVAREVVVLVFSCPRSCPGCSCYTVSVPGVVVQLVPLGLYICSTYFLA